MIDSLSFNQSIHQVCDAHFIGPESVTRPLQEKIYRNLAHWSVPSRVVLCNEQYEREAECLIHTKASESVCEREEETPLLPKPHFHNRPTTIRDARRLPRENLEALLEVRLPPPPKKEPMPSSSSSSVNVKQEPGAGGGGGGGVVAGEDVRGECAVCYAYRLDTTASGKRRGRMHGLVINLVSLNPISLPISQLLKTGSSSSSISGQDDDAGSTPTVACDNPQCGRIYHPRCLRGWLATLPGTQTLGVGGSGARRLMGGGGGGGGGAGVTLLGSCPYCTQAIALDVPAAGGGGSEME